MIKSVSKICTLYLAYVDESLKCVVVHLSINGVTDCARIQSTKFISLFSHMYLSIYGISHLEVIFYIFSPKQAYILDVIANVR